MHALRVLMNEPCETVVSFSEQEYLTMNDAFHVHNARIERVCAGVSRSVN
jgi:hypothetical protein